MKHIDFLKKVVEALSSVDLPIDWAAIKILDDKRINIYNGELYYGRKKVDVESLTYLLQKRQTKVNREAKRAEKRQEDGGNFLIDILNSLEDKVAAQIGRKTLEKINKLRTHPEGCSGGTPRRWIIHFQGQRMSLGRTRYHFRIVEQHNITKKFRLSSMNSIIDSWSNISGNTRWYVAKNFLNKAAEQWPQISALLADPQ